MLWNINKDENVNRFALSAIRGGLLEREREKERDREESEIFWDIIHGLPMREISKYHHKREKQKVLWDKKV